MQSNVIENSLKAYLEKQKAFKTLVKDVQKSLQAKEYKELNQSFEGFIKSKWNISKAQAYRFLISAKVIDQLEEFEIQPCYERICRSLYNCAKTPKQMKLLWGSTLNAAGNRPDTINSSHVKKMWKELCNDKKYAKICHYEDEIMSKVEKSLNEYSMKMKQKQLYNRMNGNIPQYYPSPIMTIPVIPSNYGNLNNQIPNNQIQYQVSTNYPSPVQSNSLSSLNESISYCTTSSPVSVCSSSSNLYEDNSIKQYIPNTVTVTVPTNSYIECPVYQVPQPQPVNTKLFTNYQTQPQPQPQPQQVVYYY